jgi:hypothetical protein
MTLLRLALATGMLLAPGAIVARALGLRTVAATLAWSLAVLFAALAVTFAAGASLTVTLVLLLAAGVVAVPFARRAPRGERVPGRAWVFLTGAMLGLVLWHVAGEIGGDGLFHLARARKLEAFDSLSLEAVNEFADGGLHPGYAFPVWHAFVALVAKVAFLDPSAVVLHEASVLAPLAVLVAYEAGYVLFRAVGPAVAVACAQVAVAALAPGHGGAYTALGLPATASRQLLVPAALALAFAYVREPGRGLLLSTAAAGLVLAAVHPTYALFLWIPFAGFLVLRSLLAREEARPLAGALGALAVPAGLFLAWLAPVVRETASVAPAASEKRRAIAHYAGQLDLVSDLRYRLAPEVFGRAGAVAVAALLLLPLAGLALRRRWAAFALGGALAVFAVTLVAAIFTPLSDLVSLSQSRRAAGFWPLAFAFAGGLTVLTGLLRFLVLPLALAAGIGFQLAYPGDFAYRLQHGGPALITWIAVGGAVAAPVLALALRRPIREWPGALVGIAAGMFVFPVVVHAASNWSPSDARRPSPLTPGLVEALRERVPEGAIVYSDLESSYRIAAFAPVYVANGPPGHVADTEENRPYERRTEARRFFATGDLSIPRRAGAGWLVVDRSRFEVAPAGRPLYEDERYVLYRLRP